MLKSINLTLKKITKKFLILLVFCYFLCLNGCTIIKPPLEFAPDGNIINQAIILQLKKTQTNLSQSLKSSFPELEINQITIKKTEPIFINKLASYHLKGTYNLTLKYPQETIKQKNNQFEIYLQRQAEGKTWRLLKKIGSTYYWESYFIS